jgi:cobalamin-dependent methionine synthase I
VAELSQQAQFQRASADERYAMAQELRTSMALDTARRQDERLMNAINQSANLTESQSRNLVDTINAVTGVQDMRVQSALDVLDRNIEWQMFLAEFGLKRDQVMEMIDQQRFAELMPLLNAYAEAIKIGTAGWRTQGSRT